MTQQAAGRMYHEKSSGIDRLGEVSTWTVLQHGKTSRPRPSSDQVSGKPFSALFRPTACVYPHRATSRVVVGV